MRWALFFMGEYIHLFVGAAFFTTLFLGGWSINPITGYDLPLSGGFWLIALQFGIVIGKVFLLVFLAMLVRWTLPRFRFDQLMRLAWEGMIPTSLLLVLIVSIYIYFGWESYLWSGSIVALIIMSVARPLLPTSKTNKRVKLVGSRFSPSSTLPN
jgi:NADH-quinone oxidoreductase subunit H